MLVLSRKLGQKVQIGQDITLTVVRLQGNTVRIGIEAPKHMKVLRAELPPLEAATDPYRGMTTATGMSNSESAPAARRNGNGSQSESAPRRDRSLTMATNHDPRRAPEPNPHRWTVMNMRDRAQQSPSLSRSTSSLS